MEKIFVFNDVEFWEYMGRPDETREIITIGMIMENALMNPKMLDQYSSLGRIIIVKDTKGYILANTFLEKSSNLPQFLAGHRNDAIGDHKILNAFAMFCKSMGVSMMAARNACVSYTANDVDKMKNINEYFNSID